MTRLTVCLCVGAVAVFVALPIRCAHASIGTNGYY